MSATGSARPSRGGSVSLLVDARNDRRAFTDLYAAYNDRLVALVASRTNNHALAEDVAHETLLRAVARADRFDPDRPLWPWLSTIAVNLAIDILRRKDSHALELQQRDDVGDATDMADDLGRRDLLLTALRQIPERQREALVLCYLEDWSPAAVARRLGLQRAAVDQLLFRARRSLRHQYEQLEGREGIGVLVPLWLWLARRGSRCRRLAMDLRHRMDSLIAPMTAAADAATLAFVATAVALSIPMSPPAAATADSAPRTVVAANADRNDDVAEHQRPARRSGAAAEQGPRARSPQRRVEGGRDATAAAPRRNISVALGEPEDGAPSARNEFRQEDAVHADSDARADVGNEQATVYSNKEVRCEGTTGGASCAASKAVFDITDEVDLP